MMGTSKSSHGCLELLFVVVVVVVVVVVAAWSYLKRIL